MVQGGAGIIGMIPTAHYTSDSRKSGSEQFKKPVQVKREVEKKKEETKDKINNSWGPVYKNREHFINMHLC